MIRLFLMILLLRTCLVSAQGNIPEVKPLLPNAAALFKVLDRPIGTYTGTIPISFPLVSVNSGSLSAKLNLNYNSTGGLKVSESAGSVGLGFSLDDGGGRITQVVNGLADDKGNGLLKAVIKPANFTCTDLTGDVTVALDPLGLDLEPDVFMYNFNGQSGKFFFRADGTIIMMQKTGIKIEPAMNTSGIQTWKITDESGNQYFFTAKLPTRYIYFDRSTSQTTEGVSSNSWYLTSACDMNQENWLYYTHEITGAYFTSNSGGRMLLGSLIDCDAFDILPHDNLVTTDGSEYMVSRIGARDGFIKISSSEGRPDGSGRKVDSIRLFTPDSVLVKRIKFNYSTFISSDNTRLKLVSFSEFAPFNNTDSITHSFAYEPGGLPKSTSNNVDSWGFYNGFINSSVFPNYVFKTGDMEYRRTDLGNKNTVPDYAKGWLLNRITYPTGGRRDIVYEGNTALMTFNPSMYHPDLSNTALRTFNHSQSEFSGTAVFPTALFTKYFTVNSTDGGSYFKYDMSVPSSCAVRARLFKTAFPNQATGGTQIFDISLDEYATNILNGFYRLEFYRIAAGCTVTGIYGSWGECILSLGTVQSPHSPGYTYNENIMPVGGLRVKEVRDYDPVTNKTSTTAYRYKLYSTDSNLTSGLLITQPQYIAAQQPSGVGCFTYAVLANSNHPLVSEGGSYVVYPEVRTIESGNGYVDQIFSFAADFQSVAFPYTPPISGSANRGKLLQEKYYDNNGTLLRKTVNSYTTTGLTLNQLGIRVRAYWYCASCPTSWSDHHTPNTDPSIAYCTNFSLNGLMANISQSIDSSFTPGGVLVNRTKYEYDTLMMGRMFLRKVTTVLNHGQTKTTTYKYPFTANNRFTFGLHGSESTMKSALLSNNYLQPIEVVDSLVSPTGVGTFLGGSKSIYTSVSSKIRLSKVRQYTTLTDSVEINLSQYDAAGNLAERYQTNNVREVYLWGYNNAYPVAKVTGSTHAIVSGLVNDAVLQRPFGDASLRTELNKIRNNFSTSLAQITSYTYKRGVGMTSETDPSGRTTYYNYDAFGQLILVKDHDGKVLKKYCYNYNGQQPDNCNVYGNVAKSGTFTRNNCGAGYTGSTVTYTVPANTYYATSQAQADAEAQADVTANGQAYANAQGTCTAIIPTTTVTYTKDLRNVSAVYFKFTDISSGAQYNFAAIPDGLNSGTLGTLPYGYYDVEIYNSNNLGYHYYSFACAGGTSGSPYAYFYSIYISSSCNGVSIDL